MCRLIAYRRFKSSSLRQRFKGFQPFWNPFIFCRFLPVFPYTRFFIRVFFCRSERRKKRKFRRFFSFELNVRFPLQFGSYIFTPPAPRQRLGLESHKKRFDKNSQAFFLCGLLLSPTYLFCFGSTKWRSVPLHYTYRRRARSDEFLRFRRKHTFFRSTTNNRRTNSFEPFAQPTVAKIATQGWLQCTTFFVIII